MKQDGHFTRRELLSSLCYDTDGISAKSLVVSLNRLIADHKIERVAHGTYRVLHGGKSEFMYDPDEAERTLGSHVREHFPFVDYCIWRSSVLTPLMQHVPACRIMFVDVERVAIESVFHSLQNMGTDAPVFLNPTDSECERYLSNVEAIIVRPLVKEAPVMTVDGCVVPTMEKVLVDATGDKELFFLQGNELHTIYANAFSTYPINENRLLRYASRRNRKTRVENILESIRK